MPAIPPFGWAAAQDPILTQIDTSTQRAVDAGLGAAVERVELARDRAEPAATRAEDARDRAEPAATRAEEARDRAEPAAVQAGEHAEAANAAAETAALEAGRAVAAQNAAFVNANVYPDVATGRAAVADGVQFQVLTGAEYVRYRRDSSTTQTEVGRYPTSAAVNGKADILNSGKLTPSRDAAFNMGQAALPSSLGLLFTQEGNGFAIRNPVTNVDDPLFDTVPHWGVIMRMPSTDLMASLLAGKAPTIQGVIPVTLPVTGNGENYALTIPQMPVGGQLYYFTANADSVGAPTVTITSGAASLTTPLVFADGRGSAVLRAGSIYIVQHTPNATLVLSQKDAAPDAPSPVALARAVAGGAAPNSYGTHQPLEISGPVPFQLQPFQSRSCVQMRNAAGVIDCSYVVPGTVCEVFLRSGDKVIAGSGRNFVGESVGMATAAGDCIVRIVAFYGRVGIEQVCGPAVSFSVADAIAYNDAVVFGGQSNAQLGYSYGIIGGFSKAMRTSIATCIPQVACRLR